MNQEQFKFNVDQDLLNPDPSDAPTQRYDDYFQRHVVNLMRGKTLEIVPKPVKAFKLDKKHITLEKVLAIDPNATMPLDEYTAMIGSLCCEPDLIGIPVYEYELKRLNTYISAVKCVDGQVRLFQVYHAYKGFHFGPSDFTDGEIDVCEGLNTSKAILLTFW